jgi:methylated-DNA-[protein]-cysteine S-methyltransferase
MNATSQKTNGRKRPRSEQTFTRETNESTSVRVTAFETALHWMAIAWDADKLQGVVFGHPTRRKAEDAVMRVQRLPRQECCIVAEEALDDAPQWVRQLVDDLRRFADGDPVDFSYVPISQMHLTLFGRRVVAACRRLRWGQTSSYSALAAKCGASGAARAVGTVMAKNRFPLVVPCHRVLAAGGKLGGYSAPGGLQTKRQLLGIEAGS